MTTRYLSYFAALLLFCITTLAIYEFTSRYTGLVPKPKVVLLVNKTSFTQETKEFDLNQVLGKRIKERRTKIQEYCKKHHRNDTIIGKDLRYHIVFESEKIVYCYIPKVASTQWKSSLVVLEASKENQTISDIHDFKFKALNNYPPEDAERILNTYFTFLFVRDPFVRVLSAYKNKFLKMNKVFHRAFGKQIIEKFRFNATNSSLETGSDVTFSEFTDFLVTDKRMADEHWRSFDRLCHPCAIDYDFIGHFEEVEEEVPYLLKSAGIDDRVSFPPKTASNTTADLLYYYSGIPKKRILQLAKLYESDFEMFGYNFPGELRNNLNAEK